MAKVTIKIERVVCDHPECDQEAEHKARLSLDDAPLRTVDLCDAHAAPILALTAAAPKRRTRLQDMPFLSEEEVRARERWATTGHAAGGTSARR